MTSNVSDVGRDHGRTARRLAALMVAGLFGAACAGAGSIGSAGSNYPSKPITIIVPFATGAAGDVAARTIGDLIGKRLKTAITIRDIPGGNGAPALDALGGSAPDGYTLMLGTTALLYTLGSNLASYKATDLAFVSQLSYEPEAIFVAASSPIGSLPALLAAARARPNSVTVMGVGKPSAYERLVTSLGASAGSSFVYVPTQAGPKVVAAVLGGHVQAGTTALSNGSALVAAGKLKVLALTSAEADPYQPSLPTLKSLGIDFQEVVWRGLLTRSGTPAAILDKLQAAVQWAITQAAWKSYLQQEGQVPAYLSAAAFTAQATAQLKDVTAYLAAARS